MYAAAAVSTATMGTLIHRFLVRSAISGLLKICDNPIKRKSTATAARFDSTRAVAATRPQPLIHPIHESDWFLVPFGGYVFGGLYRCVYDMYVQYRAIQKRVERARIRYLALGGFVATTLALTDVLPRFGVAWLRQRTVSGAGQRFIELLAAHDVALAGGLRNTQRRTRRQPPTR